MKRYFLIIFCVLSLMIRVCPVYASEVQTTASPSKSKQETLDTMKDGAKAVYGATKDAVVDTGEIVSKKGEKLIQDGETSVEQGSSKVRQGVDEKVNRFWENYDEFHAQLKSITAIVFVGSIVVGALVVVCFRKDKSLRQRALRAFCGFFPIVMLAIVFFMPYARYGGTAVIDAAKGKETKMETVPDTTTSKRTMEIYNNVLLRINSVDDFVEVEQEAYKVWNGYEHLNSMLKSHLFAMILGCEMFGIFIALLSRKDKTLRKWAGVSLCLVMPILLLMIVYLIPVVEKIFV